MTSTSAKTKLIGSLGLPAVVLLGIMLTLVLSTNVVRRATERARDESLTLAFSAQHMRFHAVQVQQWLTDISATRGRDGLDDGFAKAEESRKAFQAGLEQFRAHFESAGDVAGVSRIDALASAFESYFETGATMARAYVEGGPETGNILMGSFDEQAERLTKALVPFVEDQADALRTGLASIDRLTTRLRDFVFVAGAAALVLSIILLIATIRSIIRPMERIASALTAGARETAAAAHQVSTSSQDLASGAAKQAASLEEAAAALSEIAGTNSRNHQATDSAAELARMTRSAADTSANDLHGMNAAMQEIRRSSEDIRAIIKTIDEIAFQTNILALNASVEAARAGEAGAGFAVVAEEVRSLAQRSAKAAQETEEKIDGATAKATHGVALTSRVITQLDGIVAQVRQIDDLMGGINKATHEESRGLNAAAKSVDGMDGVTQANAATAQETAAAAEELNAQAEMLDAVARELSLLVTGRTHVPESSFAARSDPVRTPVRATWSQGRSSQATTAATAPVDA